MIFTVERLGPVNRAEIDLSKDLILLTGPNGTGKTYVAWAVYGFLDLWKEAFLLLRNDASVHAALEPAVTALLTSEDSESDLATIVRVHGLKVIQVAADRYVARLAEDFAAQGHLFEHTSLQIQALDDVWHSSADTPVTVHVDGSWSLVGTMKPGTSRLIVAATKLITHADIKRFEETGSFSEQALPLARVPSDKAAAVRDALTKVLTAWVLLLRRPLSPIIFPAERIATTIFWRELSLRRTKLVDEMLSMEDESLEQVLELMRNRAQRYPRPIRDSLLMAGDLERWSREQSEFTDLADYLEQHLLRGKVRLSQYGSLEFVPDQRSDIALGMHITASVVKSLSMLVFYFRHRARKGDFVIIDEPELNLHPDNQRLIARVLARAVNRGLKIMASTHSDYLVRELNNLIMLGQDTEPVKALRQKHGYEEAELLKPSQLGVYLFRDNAAEAVPVDETGFSIATIDAEIDRLNAVSQEIYATLFEQEPE